MRTAPEEGLREQALCRSRGGLTSKIHLACDGRGRPPGFDRETYKYRHVAKRCFNRLKQWRGIATLHDKTDEPCKAALASLLMWA